MNLLIGVVAGLLRVGALRDLVDLTVGLETAGERRFEGQVDVRECERDGGNNDDRSKVSVVRDSIRMFDEVRQIRRNAKRGIYKADT